MKKAIFSSVNSNHINSAYDKDSREIISKYYDLDKTIIRKSNIEEHLESVKSAEAIFTTWGMEHYTSEEIDKYFPNLKYVFYAAGSVQDFAKEFLEKGIRVFSAASANAIPVSEYTVAMILLANKCGPNAIKKTARGYYSAWKRTAVCSGNYKTKIGVIGAGKIGSMVIEKLGGIIDAKFYAYDPFLSDERAKTLGVTKCSLEELFSTCDVITNHLANKKELEGILNYNLFSRMKNNATFINSGRGKQVNEKDLVKALKENKTRNAILDVTFPEPAGIFSPLRRMSNIFLTPHIAGSLGGEIRRMGDYMVADVEKLENGESSMNEVTLEMLKTMA